MQKMEVLDHQSRPPPSASVPQRVLPDPAICRASSCTREFADCLVAHPVCRYALRFGYGCLCYHPGRNVIIARTLALAAETHYQPGQAEEAFPSAQQLPHPFPATIASSI